MRDQEEIKRTTEMIWTQIRAMKGYFFLPLIFIFVIQPVYCFITLKTGYGFDDVYIADKITACISCACPALSLFWAVWLMTKYIENEDRELYYMEEKIKWTELKLYYWLFIFVVGIAVFIGLKWLGVKNGIFLFITTAALCYLYYALFYFICYVTESVAIALLPFLIYTFWVLAPGQFETYKISYLNLIWDGELKGLVWSAAFIISGTIVSIYGKKLNKKYCNY